MGFCSREIMDYMEKKAIELHYRCQILPSYATEAALTFVMIAYNLMSIFRMFVLQENTQKRLSTLRWRSPTAISQAM